MCVCVYKQGQLHFVRAHKQFGQASVGRQAGRASEAGQASTSAVQSCHPTLQCRPKQPSKDAIQKCHPRLPPEAATAIQAYPWEPQNIPGRSSGTPNLPLQNPLGHPGPAQLHPGQMARGAIQALRMEHLRTGPMRATEGPKCRIRAAGGEAVSPGHCRVLFDTV